MLSPNTRVKPEVMSPAGHWPQLRAAIEAGADAVYFGLNQFSARAKVGFSLEELPEAVRTLHRRAVRGYLTFNTLVFEHELANAAETIAQVAETGIDALIIQDLGVAQIARAIAPHLELHASTQMSITNAAGVRLAQQLGMQRVTLARELDLAEIESIARETGCELEVFVHGALCVAYSGQCFSSEAWGGRSANRGQCAQACRLPYGLVVDGVSRPLDEARYLLSPGDLYALEQVPELVRIGVSALKIEGRYKDAEYVALATSAYRKAVDQAWETGRAEVSPRDRLLLEQVYSRGLAPHFLTGTNHQHVVEGRAPRHRGVYIGDVIALGVQGIVVAPTEAHSLAPLKPGDGVVFDAASWRSPEEQEEGGNLYAVEPSLDGTVTLRFANGAIDQARIRPGDRLWRSSDADVARAARPYLASATPVARLAVDASVTACAGDPLRVNFTVRKTGLTVTIASPDPLVPGRNRALTEANLREQLGRLGDTAFELERLQADIVGDPFVPLSLLNQLRRDAVALLDERMAAVPDQHLNEPAAIVSRFVPPAATTADADQTAQLHLLVRTPAQLEAAIALGPDSITLDYLDLYGLRPSVERVRERGIVVRVATPRILKPGERRITQFLAALHCPLLVRGAGMAAELRQARTDVELVADFSLNAANSVTSRLLLEDGFARITPGHDLNARQIQELAQDVGGRHFEAIAFQHLPVFHTEHCVFCRFLSTGTSYRDCGRPCETHQAALRDEKGRQHPVLADVGCRNTIFGAEAQEASLHLDTWKAAGIGHFRLEFVNQNPKEVRQIAEAFRLALSGKMPGRELSRKLAQIVPGGTTEGSLTIPKAASFTVFAISPINGSGRGWR